MSKAWTVTAWRLIAEQRPNEKGDVRWHYFPPHTRWSVSQARENDEITTTLRRSSTTGLFELLATALPPPPEDTP